MKKKEVTFEEIRKKLMGLRQDLIKESNAEIGQMLNQGDKYNGVSDDGDLADIALRDSFQATQLARHQSRLNAVNQALDRIEEGTYGICSDCEEEIPVGRLKALPFALRCVDCQEKHEMLGTEYEEPIIHHSAITPNEESEE